MLLVLPRPTVVPIGEDSRAPSPSPADSAESQGRSRRYMCGRWHVDEADFKLSNLRFRHQYLFWSLYAFFVTFLLRSPLCAFVTHRSAYIMSLHNENLSLLSLVHERQIQSW